ncbi:MAG: helix-turn-helix transcriptional regulator [Pyrinomonadaceae bacterium]
MGLPSSYQLWKGTAQSISLKTLNTLCNKLRTHPAILFDYTPDSEEGTTSSIKSGKGRK